MRAKRVKWAAEQSLDIKENPKKIGLFEKALCDALELYELA